MKREKILQEAERLINGDRAAAYGDAYVNHKRIADMWSVIFGQEVTVTCGVAPDYVSGKVVTIETTKNTNL